VKKIVNQQQETPDPNTETHPARNKHGVGEGPAWGGRVTSGILKRGVMKLLHLFRGWRPGAEKVVAREKGVMHS